MKLYCFLYDITENMVYRQEHEAEECHGDYFVHDKDDETIFVRKDKIDNPQPTDGPNQLIYVYTFTDDVNHAMELMRQMIEKSYAIVQEKAQKLEQLIKVFDEKQKYVKAKYKDGKKSKKQRNDKVK